MRATYTTHSGSQHTGAEQRRLRQLIQHHYTVPAVKPDRPLLRARAETLISAMPAGEPFDLVSSFVEPIVGFGICNRVGYDQKDHARVMSWGRVVTKIFVGLDAADQDWVGDGFKAMFDHLDEIIAERQAAPRDKVLDRLIAAHNDGLMSYNELRAMLGNIVTGGYATTQYALIWLVWYLLNLPETLARIRSDFSLMPAAVKELLRMEPPVEGTFRTAQQDIEAGAIGYLLKDVHADKLAQAIRDAHHGRSTLDAMAAQSLIQAATQPPQIGADLTPRELEVLALLVEIRPQPASTNPL